MRSVIRFAALVLLCANMGVVSAQDGTPAPDPQSELPTDDTFFLTQGEVERSYYLHFPPAYDGVTPVPLVIALHGAGMSGTSMMLATDFNTQADLAGHMVAYPDGVSGYWNYYDAEHMPGDWADVPYYDDTQYITDLIAQLSETYAVDSSRIYLVGYSNGGMLGLRLRCEMGDQLAGTVAVGASLTLDVARYCTTPQPSPVLLVVGTQDGAFPWLGYALPLEDGGIDLSFSISQAMMYLSALNHCEQGMQSLDVTAPNSPVRIMRDSYTGCAHNTTVMLYSLIQVGHDWPGYYTLLLNDGSPGTMADAIWEFLASHQLP
jgi:polyhydroxybutyrate depolymerase